MQSEHFVPTLCLGSLKFSGSLKNDKEPRWLPGWNVCFEGCNQTEPDQGICNHGVILCYISTPTLNVYYHYIPAIRCTCISGVFCGSPPNINNGALVSVTGLYGSDSATYTCNTGYSTTQQQTVTCLSTGQWATPPSCSGIGETGIVLLVKNRIHNIYSAVFVLIWNCPCKFVLEIEKADMQQ